MFKHQENMIDVFLVHSLLNQVMFDMKNYCDEQAMPFLVTEMLTSKEIDKEYKRVSSSHRTGRAFDISVRDWKPWDISRFLNHYNTKYKKIAAVNGSNVARFAVLHDSGFGAHIHVQIHMRYKRWELNTTQALREMRTRKVFEIAESVGSIKELLNKAP
jgi:hypothetical protein